MGVPGFFSLRSLTFNNTAGAFSFSGAGSLNIGVGGITNNDPDTMTFGVLTNFTAASSINATSGALTFTNTLGLGANALTLNGGSAISFNGPITGTGTITKSSTGVLSIASSASTISADFVLNSGTTTLSAGSTQTFSSGSAIQLSGGNLTLNESAILDGGSLTRAGGNLSIAAGKTLTLQNGADISYSSANLVLGNGSTVAVTGAGSTFTMVGAAALTVNNGTAVTLTAGGTFSTASYMDIGTSGSGSLSVSGTGSSATALAPSFWGIGPGTVNVSFSNNATGTFGELDIARTTPGSNATVQVASGADVTSSNLRLAADAIASTASFSVSGAGSTWAVNGAGTTTIGAASTSTSNFIVTDSGTFTSGTGDITVGATGSVSVSLNGTFNANGNMIVNGGTVARTANGVFNLTAGKTLTMQGGGDFTVTGVYEHSTASTVTVTGSGSTLSTNAANDLRFNGGSTMNVLAGADVTSGGALMLATTAAGGSATMLVDGVGSTFNAPSASWGNGAAANVTFSNSGSGSLGHLAVAGSSLAGTSATVNINSGGSFAVNSLALANGGGGASGTITIDGPNAALFMVGPGGGTIGSASSSTATVNINNTGLFSTGSGTVTVRKTGHISVAGGNLSLNGNLTLDGGTLTKDSSGNVVIGSGRSFTVQNGGVASFGGSGYALNSSSNTVTVTGAASQITGTGPSTDFEVDGGSSLSVLAGGSLAFGGFLNLGDFGGGTNTLLVDGTGSSVSIGSSGIWGAAGSTVNATFRNNAIGTFGATRLASNGGSGTTATLLVSSGADVTFNGALQLATGSVATAATTTVTGVGSTLALNGGLVIGAASFSNATLNVNAGATLSMAAGTLTLNPTGTLNVDGGTATIAGPVTFGGGAVNFTSGALSFSDSSVNLNVGIGGLLGTSLTFAADRQLTIGGTTTIEAFRTLTLDGGSLSTGSLVNNGTLAFNSGRLAITGAGGFEVGSGALGSSVVLGTGATLQITNNTVITEGASFQTDGGSFTTAQFNNSGLTEHTRGTFTMANGGFNATGADFFISRTATTNGVFTNQSGAQIVLTGGTGRFGGTGSLVNSGVLRGDGTVSAALTNSASGTIRAESGKTLRVTGSVAANAGTVSLEGGTVEFSNSVTNSATGFISGRGALNTNGLTNNGVMAFSGGVTDIRGDVANASGARIVTSGAGSTTTFFDDVVHNGTEIFTGVGASTVFFGNQSGAGAFTGTGTVYYNGDLRPGNSPATVNYGGNVVFAPGTELTLEIGGVSEGTEYDSLQIANALTVDGMLTLMLINGFAPGLGNVFDLIDAASINGTFDTVNLPTLAQYLAWNTSNLYTTGEVSVGSTLTPIQQWRLQNFSDPSNSGDGADNNDFDKDGIANLMEYALGLDPRIPSAAGLPTLGVVTVGANKHAALTVIRPLGASDVNYRFEVTGDLVSYDPGSFYGAGGDVPSNAFTTEVSRTNNGSVETIVVRDNTALSGSAKRFLRLKITNPAP